MTSDIPAMLGGQPTFPALLPMVRPTIPAFDELQPKFKQVLESGMLTNASFARALEAQVKSYTGGHYVQAISSCTAGLMLSARIQKWRGQVITPSFTFCATAHAIAWNGLEPVFVDCDPKTFTIDPSAVQEAITDKTSAILATHVFGNPVDMDAISQIASDHHLNVVYDAAHALGSFYKGKHIPQWGSTHVYSMSPTKLVTACEGGILITDDQSLSEGVQVGRDYGNPGNYDCQFVGLNARLSELHAIVAASTLAHLEENLSRRNEIAQRYQSNLSKLSGISFQSIAQGNRSSFKDFAIVIDEQRLGVSREAMVKALEAENIASRRYFYPPVHAQHAYAYLPSREVHLPHTIKLSQSILCLPIFSTMTDEQVDAVCRSIQRIVTHGTEVSQRVARRFYD